MKNPYHKAQARKWTPQETQQLQELIQQGKTTTQIAETLGRTKDSISIKRKRLSKENKTHTYNKKHLRTKRNKNMELVHHIKPRNILDPYNGGNNQYHRYKVTTNDKDEVYDTDYHMDAYKFLMHEYLEGHRYDLIDLDPYGSCYDLLPLAFKLLRTTAPTGNGGGVMITFGEMGHKRWKRLDYVRSHYSINCLEDFTLKNLLLEVERIAQQNKKSISLFDSLEYGNIGRVYLTVHRKPVTEQWKKNTLFPKNINVGVTEEVEHELMEIADSNDCSVSVLMRDLIDDFIENNTQ